MSHVRKFVKLSQMNDDNRWPDCQISLSSVKSLTIKFFCWKNPFASINRTASAPFAIIVKNANTNRSFLPQSFLHLRSFGDQKRFIFLIKLIHPQHLCLSLWNSGPALYWKCNLCPAWHWIFAFYSVETKQFAECSHVICGLKSQRFRNSLTRNVLRGTRPLFFVPNWQRAPRIHAQAPVCGIVLRKHGLRNFPQGTSKLFWLQDP